MGLNILALMLISVITKRRHKMRKYEILILLQPNLDTEVKSKVTSKIETIIGGNIVKKED
jgi:ribosomal protein S6